MPRTKKLQMITQNYCYYHAISTCRIMFEQGYLISSFNIKKPRICNVYKWVVKKLNLKIVLGVLYIEK